ncbi:ABC transporter ATP-binding protein [Longimycelium tulufanense]|uniref:ABC transporter ATP-binding protein n=1 Tax=Longimycelium tulufanense TaxID=907463 RepID=A0A8J3CA26_9PSEU|nr:ABC transporter ATP-binding protein [Longimycelium tulufanense]GGM63142.1 ABC transporter ATP-binding protein [Longimycelium tulufanense]
MSANPGDRLLRRVFLRSPGWLTALLIGGMAGTAATLLLPDAVARGVDGALSPTADAGGAALWVLLLALVVVAGDAVGMVGEARCTSRGTAWLRHRLIEHLLALGVPGHRRFAPGDAVSRFSGDAAQAGTIAATLVRLANAATVSLGAVVALAVLDWWLAVVFLLSLPLALRLAGAHLRRTAGDVATYQRVVGELSARLLDAVGGLRTIQGAGLAEREADRVLRPLPRLAAAGHALWLAQAALAWRAGLLLPAVEVAVLAAAGLGVAMDRIGVGDVVAAAGYVALGMAVVRQASALTALARARAAARRIDEVLCVPPAPAGYRPVPPGEGTLELRGVRVRDTDGKVILSVPDLVVPAGSVVAVVGRSGSGKSVFAALVAGLSTPDDGEVLLEGTPLCGLAPESVRHLVACAFARPVLLGRTVTEAIGYGRPGTPFEQVRDAAVDAQIHDLVERLPHGYETPMPDVPLSGGEAQRLGLARALAGTPRVLVLDDATSNVDSATAVRVETAITRRMVGRTRIVVTHRLPTAASADLVLWLDEGRVRGRGAHHDLWREPDYRAVFSTW